MKRYPADPKDETIVSHVTNKLNTLMTLSD
jgi:hypothetical protein